MLTSSCNRLRLFCAVRRTRGISNAAVCGAYQKASSWEIREVAGKLGKMPRSLVAPTTNRWVAIRLGGGGGKAGRSGGDFIAMSGDGRGGGRWGGIGNKAWRRVGHVN
jgi:hypothetical protein